MPAIHQNSLVYIQHDENVSPSDMAHEVMDLHCTNCGNIWRIVIPPERTSYQLITKAWEKRWASMMSHITEVMRFHKKIGNGDPFHAKMMHDLNEIRERMIRDDLIDPRKD